MNGIRQNLWPDHCVQEHEGAEFHPKLHTKQIDHIFRKGTDPNFDSYSGFFDNARKHSTGLKTYLEHHRIDKLFICGLTTDYCVKITVLDALELGFNTNLLVVCGGNTSMVSRVSAQVKKANCMRCVSISEDC